MKYFTKKIIAVLLTVMLTGITVLHVSGDQTIKVNAAQTFKVHFIDVGAADGALLQYGEGENAKYALIDSGAYSYETTDHDTIDVSDRVHQYLLDHGVKHLEFVVLTHPHGDHIGGMKKILEDKNITIDTIYGNPLEFEYLESSEDKEKQTEETARWTAFDTQTYYPEVSKIDPKNIFTVTVMPCTAKKYEADRPEMEVNGLREIDATITTRELAKLIKDAKINFVQLEDSEADPAMGEYTGAGTIFGATGGVMEAAIRSAKEFAEKKELENVDYVEVRGLQGVKEAIVEIAGNEYNVAVINGAKNLAEFINSGKINEKQYHFIEVMACPGGCVNGGGQPHVNNLEIEKNDIKTIRASVLYNQDKNAAKRKSHENTAIKKMYETYMGEPGKGLAHKLLHRKYTK